MVRDLHAAVPLGGADIDQSRILDAALRTRPRVVRELSGRRIRFDGAKLNDEGRLSAAQGCRLTDLGPTLPEEVKLGPLLYDDWSALRGHAASLAPIGLARSAELDALVVVRPAAWGRRSFDEIRQSFVWELADAAGEVVPIEVVYGDLNEPLIRHLEGVRPSGLDPSRVWGVCARLVRTGAGISLYPLSILLGERAGNGGRVVNPTLDSPSRTERGAVVAWLDRWLKKRGLKKKQTPAASRWQATVEDVEPLPAWSAATERAVSALEDDLGRLAEGGRRGLSANLGGRLRQRAAELTELGLEHLAESLATLAGGSEALIRTRYLCQITRQAAVRARITGSLDDG